MTKVVTRHVWVEYSGQAEDYRYVPEYKVIYSQRKETIERAFAEGKERHGLRYTMMRGLAKVRMHVTLIFACIISPFEKESKGKSSLSETFML